MACPLSTLLTDILTTLAPPEKVRLRARELGVIKRQGKVDAYALLMTVVLGVAIRGPVGIASLRRVMGAVTGLGLARSAFWDRFTPTFAELVKWLLDLVVQQANQAPRRPPGRLSCFKDIIAVDSSVVKVHDLLRGVWCGTRTNSAVAALKVHVWVRVFTGELLQYKVTPEASPDCGEFKVNHSLSGVLVLLDKGYSSPSLWRRITGVGGDFLTRLPADRDPLIVADHRAGRRNSRKLVGKRLRAALAGLRRHALDVEVELRCSVRKYRSSRNRHVMERFRLVAIRNPKTRKYTVFITSVPPKVLPPELVARMYRLRWEVEHFFKTAKSGSGLNELPSSKPHIVLALVYASLIRAAVSMQARANLQTLVEADVDVVSEINPNLWQRWWNQRLPWLLAGLVEAHRKVTTPDLLRLLGDPNRGRPSSRRVLRSWRNAA